MATPSKNYTGVGERSFWALRVDCDGVISATSTTAYEGERAEGAKSFEISAPDTRVINFMGDDRVFASIQLPPTEITSATLTTGKKNQDFDELVTGNLSFTEGEVRLQAVQTDNQGDEKDVFMITSQLAVDGGSQVYRSVFMTGKCVPVQPGSFNDNPLEPTYTITPYVSDKLPWFTALTSTTHGATEAQFFEAVTEGRPKVVGYVGNGANTTFTLPTTALGTNKIIVYVIDTSTDPPTSVDWTSTATLATTGITFTSTDAPAATKTLFVWYEEADGACA